MNLTETINKMKQVEGFEVGGGATGVSSVPDPINLTAVPPGNNSPKGAPKPKKSAVDETDPENNSLPTGDYSVANRASVATKQGNSMKEFFTNLFDGEELSEEFKEKVSVLFEAAIIEKSAAITSSLQEDYDLKLNSKIEELEEQSVTELATLVEQLDEYLTYGADQWMQENKLAIEPALKSEITEEFIQGLKNLFAEHYIDMPEDKVDIVEQLTIRCQDLETKINKVVNENISLTASINEMNTEEVFNEIAEGLVSTQIEKFKKLSEGVEFENLSVLKKKLQIIRENYFSGDKTEKKTSSFLEESFEGEEHLPVSKGPMAHYVKAISKTIVK